MSQVFIFFLIIIKVHWQPQTKYKIKKRNDAETYWARYEVFIKLLDRDCSFVECVWMYEKVIERRIWSSQLSILLQLKSEKFHIHEKSESFLILELIKKFLKLYVSIFGAFFWPYLKCSNTRQLGEITKEIFPNDQHMTEWMSFFLESLHHLIPFFVFLFMVNLSIMARP